MAEEYNMTEENKKTIISFIAGLLIGGLLVFIFIEPANDIMPSANNDRDEETEMSNDDEEVDESDEDADSDVVAMDDNNDAESVVISDGAIEVNDQEAGSSVALDSVEFPANTGWIGVRDYVAGQMTGLLGVARFDVGVGLLPSSVQLVRPTVAGNTYAIVFYSDNGDKEFHLSTDAQLSGTMETFKAE